MAQCGVKIIVQVSDVFSDFDSIKEAYEDFGKEDFCKAIYSHISADLRSSFSDMIDYIPPMNPKDLKEWTLGVEDPEKVKETAIHWNDGILKELKWSLEPFEKLRKKWNQPDLFSVLKLCEEGMKEEGFKYDTALYNLRKSLAVLDDRFDYGINGMVMTQNEYGYWYGTKMDELTLQKVQEKPEEFVVFWLYYE